jgi:hypothetical protein
MCRGGHPEHRDAERVLADRLERVRIDLERIRIFRPAPAACRRDRRRWCWAAGRNGISITGSSQLTPTLGMQKRPSRCSISKLRLRTNLPV